jgi:geranylgeranyl reductase family protein
VASGHYLRIERFDVVVAGAGPAGSTAAYHLATGGASVLLLDRARFPRDKPCGGGVTVRAAHQLPFSIEPVVEDVVDRVELRLDSRRAHERVSGFPLVLMTQRRRLDAHLAERAAAAGADFRDGVRVTAVEVDPEGVTVDVGRERIRAAALVGADGVNGIVARSLGLCAAPDYGVALEGDMPIADTTSGRYRGRIIFDIGTVAGGYGWAFPKGDHVNLGVGGRSSEAPRLRAHLSRLCQAHGTSVAGLANVRGYRLPVARPEAILARGRALVCGDAGGLVDPLTGEGIYEAIVSAGFAAEAVIDLLAERSPGLEPYERRVKARFAATMAYSRATRQALDRFPALMFRFARLDAIQRTLERLARDDPAPFVVRRLSAPMLFWLRIAGGS